MSKTENEPQYYIVGFYVLDDSERDAVKSKSDLKRLLTKVL
ncbi:MAG: hypothetical protein WKF68_11365 [Daejeonella sp.]